MKGLLLLLLCTLTAPAAAAPSLDEVVDRVQKVYRDTRNFRAEFNQVITLRATKRKRRAGGRVFFQKPGQFRFHYKRGEEKKVIVSDGKRVWTYLPEDAQVRIDPFSQKLAGSLRFLWGEGVLREQFQIQPHEGKEYGRAGDHVIRLIPKADEGHYKQLVFVVDPKTFEVRETVIFDPVGNINHMEFEKVARNIEIPEKVFRFRVRKGVQVVKSPELKEDE
jgi:outer membrane lipoprotein carrier protein